MRDRTGSHALQAHFGHVTRAMTDRGYVGTDFALDDLIDRHTQEETRAALEEVLTATTLAGKGGRMIAARSQFRGRTRDGAVQAYVRFLMEETASASGSATGAIVSTASKRLPASATRKDPTPRCGLKARVSPAPTLQSRPGIDRSGRRAATAMPIFSLTPGWIRSAAGLRKHGSSNAIASLANSIIERMVAMARKPSKTPALTPQEKRLRNTDRKLREALERLVKGLPTHPDLQKRSYRLTVATLAREARVGRNAIYTNHRSMIDELRRASDRKIVPEKLAAWEDKLAQQRALIQVLQIEERRMVTENAVLLKRILEAETEVERQKRHNARLVAERDRGMKPVSIPRGPKS